MKENGHRHILTMPRVRAGRGRTVHENGALVVCACGRAFNLIEAADFPKLLARAIAGTQKG